MRPHWFKWRTILGLSVLAALGVFLDVGLLLQTLTSVSPGWFASALIAATLANLLCALRWARIARFLKIADVSLPTFVCLYGQGIAINSVIPGGVVGGDAWRAAQLPAHSPLKTRIKSVFQDRLSGLWALAILGLIGALVIQTEGAVWTSLPAPWAAGYLGLLALIGCIPIVYRMGDVLAGLLSLGSQGLTVIAFWLCMLASATTLSFAQLLVLAPAIFLTAMTPASVGGFGAREGAAIFFLGLAGMSAEAAVVGSVLFGLTAMIQGALAILIWAVPNVSQSGLPVNDGR